MKFNEKITLQEIEDARTPNGGYTRASLRSFGVPWPPPKGWRKALMAQAKKNAKSAQGHRTPPKHKASEAARSSDLVIYTDGSCQPNPGPGGWSFIAFENGVIVHTQTGHAQQTTNNRMEMQAVLEAILWSGGRPVQVHSDSSYVVKGLTEWQYKWKAKGWNKSSGKPIENRSLWIDLTDAHKTADCHVTWIRGHAGHLGNEVADQLAEQARVQSSSG